MTITINQITSGIGLLINGEIFVVTEYNHVKPGKGSAFVRVKLRSVKSGSVMERTFRSAEKLDEVNLEERRMQFLYSSGTSYYFMDQSTYEESVISQEVLGDSVRFLLDNLEVTGLCYNNQVLKVDFPTFIIARVTETEPGFKGDTSRSGNKPAKFEKGTTIKVPLFINVGDYVKIDTRTGDYVERVKR